MEKRRVIALIDPVWNGHSPMYFSSFWKVLAPIAAVKLIGFCPRPDAAREFMLEQGVENPDIRELSTPPAPVAQPGPVAEARLKLAQWRGLAASLCQAEAAGGFKFDSILILWLEPFLTRYVFGWLVDSVFPFPWVGLYLHPYDFRLKPSRRYRLRNALFPAYAPLHARHCRAVLTLDEGIVSALRRKTGKPVFRLPDVTDVSPVDSGSNLVAPLKKKAGGRLICGLFGVLQKRKSLLLLLQSAGQRPPDWFFAFAGQIPRHDYSAAEWNFIQEFIRQNPENCWFWPQSIPGETEFNSLVAACDVICAAYEFFPHSSNLLTKAALFRKPVLVSPGYLMAERVNQFQLGWVLPDYSADAFLQLLTTLSREEVQRVAGTARFSEYYAVHDHASLARTLAEVIDL